MKLRKVRFVKERVSENGEINDCEVIKTRVDSRLSLAIGGYDYIVEQIERQEERCISGEKLTGF